MSVGGSVVFLPVLIYFTGYFPTVSASPALATEFFLL